jgi:cytochrome b subunit of formate dehydrogenase
MDPMGIDHTPADVVGIDAFTYILGRIANILLFIIPLIAGVSFMVAAYYYILSSGNSEKASQAKTIIKWNIIAMTVAFLSYMIVNFVLYILNLTQ